MSVYALAILVKMAQRENGLISMATDFNIAELVKLGYAVAIPGLNGIYSITEAGRDYYRTEVAA